ncbi:hypothetical protein [Polaribacter sp. Z022]|uniref:hypothetical protein n=1 Tax=Polaribacter sp. Z022 TaxID=2927125 RepID=UPI0020219997|nr:hypothetical protein [Polaribacter sp. Z022]MCL7755169.1 hypothetical protein [Polaribacter sp. Z022]
MKYAEFNIGNNKIEFLNSVFGTESVLLNDKLVSKKISLSGIKHKIILNSENFILKSKYEQFDKREIELKLIKNGETVEKQIVKADKKHRIYWMLIGIGLGIAAYKLLNLVIENLN